MTVAPWAPAFSTPRHLVEAYSTQFRSGMLDLSAPAPSAAPLDLAPVSEADLTHATPGGCRALREAIASRYRTLDADDILVTAGASEALTALACALAMTGARVDASPGTYPSFTALWQLFSRDTGGGVNGVDVRLRTNPSVPDGRRLDLDAELASARMAGAILVVDEVYRHIALDGTVPDAAADLDPCAVSIDDLSKPLGLGGLRIGWIASRHRALLHAVRGALALTSGGPSALSEAAALIALGGFDATVEAHTDRVRANAPRVYAVLAEAGWEVVPTELGMTAAAFPPTPLTPSAYERLRARGWFLLDASTMGHPGAVRVSLLAPPEVLRAALRAATRDPAPSTRRDHNALVVLMRVPRPGIGKSRLAATLGIDRTHALASAFVTDTLATAQAGTWQRMVAFTPADAVDEARKLAPGFVQRSQAEGDLGARILGALDVALARSERAVLIGSDTPDLDPAVLRAAFTALDDHEVVIGPADDGGFYLIGGRATDGRMFHGIEWSTETVGARTIANCAALGWRVALLRSWSDVDDEESLAALQRRIEVSGRAPATRRVLASMRTVLDGMRP